MLEQRYNEFIADIDGVVWEADPETLQFTFVSPETNENLELEYRVIAANGETVWLHDVMGTAASPDESFKLSGINHGRY